MAARGLAAGERVLVRAGPWTGHSAVVVGPEGALVRVRYEHPRPVDVLEGVFDPRWLDRLSPSTAGPHALRRAERTEVPMWFLTVDGRKFDWPEQTIGGATLRALVPGLNPVFLILREQEAADEVVHDDDVLDLAPTPAFYTAPPANFG